MREGYPSLTTRGGCVLAAGLAAAVCALAFDERDLLRVGVFAVAMPLLAVLYARLLRAGVTAHRELASEDATAGEELDVRLRAEVKGWMPGGELVLQDALPDVLGHSPRFRLATPFRRAERGRTLDYAISSPVRGVHTLGPLRLFACDPLGLARSHTCVGPVSRVLVVPAVHPLPAGVTRDGAGTHGVVAAAVTAGSGEPDMVVREYQHGDDVRKVHWRSTARRDELMVRTEEPPVDARTTVLLDHRASAHRGKGAAASLEWAVTFTASVCAHLGQRGQRYRLIVADGTVLVDDASTRGQQGRELVLDCLARLNRSPERELRCPHEPGRRLVAVLGALHPTAAETLALSRSGGAPGAAVLLDVDAWHGKAREAGSWEAGSVLRDAGWNVVHAGAEHDPARVWGELLGRSADETPAPSGRG